MNGDQISDLISKKWEELNPNKETFKLYCKTFAKGGILILKYPSPYIKNPKCCFVEDDSGGVIGAGSEKWLELTQKIVNFKALYDEYDPKLHYFIFITIHVVDEYYGQLVRLNYVSTESR